MKPAIDITKPIQPAPLSGLTLNPQTGLPQVQIQVLGTIPFPYLLDKADTEALKKIVSLGIEELRKRGERW